MKFKLILLCSVIVFFASCSSDDDNSPGSNSIVGTWKGVSLTISESFDYNGDGKESNDIFKEVPCFTITTTFNADGTQDSTVSDLEFEASEDDFTIQCNGSSSYSNTYELEGNTLTTTDEDGAIVSTISIKGSKLTVKGETADFGYATIVFERQ